MFVMHKSEIIMMEESFDRILLFFIAWVEWIAGFLGLRRRPAVLKPHPPIIAEYGKKYKDKLLLSYREEAVDDWNLNIDPFIRDPLQLTEVLKDPDNAYEKKWRSSILIENTPRGNVIMFYDIYKRSFSYYSDTAMPYEIMNAVAMKYVILFRCRDFFVDSQFVPKPPQNDADGITAVEPTPDTKIKLDKHAFAKFKTYNNATKKTGILPEDDKVINRFLHLGASRNWTPIYTKAKANPINGFKTDMIPDTNNNKLSYLDYKNMQNNK